VGRPKETSPPGRPRHRWKGTTKMGLRDVGLEDIDWTGVTEGRDSWRALVNAIMNLRVP